MIGFYDYTVILTYMSLASAVSGMACACSGHPIWATLCLLFCGLCDMFDGKVARTKKNRSEEEKAFGIQIDFNVTEEMRQKSTSEVRKSYAGLPITSAALIFPTFYSIIAVYCMCVDNIKIFLELFAKDLLSALLGSLMLITAILFIVPIKVRKPGTKTLYLFLAIGLVLAGILAAVFLLK